jgi:hypothetical protein
MLRDHWLQAAAAAIALSAAPAALHDLHPQGPGTTLRSLVPMPPAATTPAAAGDPAYDYLALRGVLGDLQSRTEYLSAEADLLQKDADRLWQAWRRVFGSVAYGVYEQRIRVKAFAFYGESRECAASARALAAKLALEERRWTDLSESLEKRPAPTGAAFESEVLRMRAALSKLADHVNALDRDVRAGQGRLDRLYPQLTTLFQREPSRAFNMEEPWHWTYYMAAGEPRPSLRYDFELQYHKRLEEARRDLAARAAARTGSLRAK